MVSLALPRTDSENWLLENLSGLNGTCSSPETRSVIKLLSFADDIPAIVSLVSPVMWVNLMPKPLPPLLNLPSATWKFVSCWHSAGVTCYSIVLILVALVSLYPESVAMLDFCCSLIMELACTFMFVVISVELNLTVSLFFFSMGIQTMFDLFLLTSSLVVSSVY